MSKGLLIPAVSALVLVLGSVQGWSASVDSRVAVSSGEAVRFLDFGFMVPSSDYKGRVFQLKTDFPDSLPEMDADLKKILSVDFKKDWQGYVALIKDYIFAGNAQSDYENSFFLEDNHQRDWNHLPWLHWGFNGREGFHGLTREGPVESQAIAPSQTKATSSYAVAIYNNRSSYVIGNVWRTGAPDLSYFKENTFPEGSISAKLLFIDLDEKQVPYLANPIVWKAYIHECDSLPSDKVCNQKDPQSRRVVRNTRLIQMDFMIRDNRAKETGWVAGTFVYNGELNHKNKWENLVPLGLIWGNDPQETESFINPRPTKTIVNSRLKQTIINQSDEVPYPMHLGWSGRLDGPIDNSASSCISCHQTAQYPPASAIVPYLNDPAVPIPANGTNAGPDWMKWFRNLPLGESFDSDLGTINLDFNLKLSKSIILYYAHQESVGGGIFASDYVHGHLPKRNAAIIQP